MVTDRFSIIRMVTSWSGTVPIYIMYLRYWAILRSLGTGILFRTTSHLLWHIGPRCVACVLGCGTTACLWPCGCCRCSPACSLAPFHWAMESHTILLLLTRNCPKRQYKRIVCTDEMTQKEESVGLREHNNDERKMNDEIRTPDGSPGGSRRTKVSTRLCFL